METQQGLPLDSQRFLSCIKHHHLQQYHHHPNNHHHNVCLLFLLLLLGAHAPPPPLLASKLFQKKGSTPNTPATPFSCVRLHLSLALSSCKKPTTATLPLPPHVCVQGFALSLPLSTHQKYTEVEDAGLERQQQQQQFNFYLFSEKYFFFFLFEFRTRCCVRHRTSLNSSILVRNHKVLSLR